jgi:hypothetical protein
MSKLILIFEIYTLPRLAAKAVNTPSRHRPLARAIPLSGKWHSMAQLLE